MKCTPNDIFPDVIMIEPDVYSDPRGHFLETFHAEKHRELGINGTFVQDNLSYSNKGVLRGLHYQIDHPQAKLVTVIEGEIFDVAVDIRRGSPTFGKWVGETLSSERYNQLYIPEGFAHGFLVLSETAYVLYKCTDLYNPASERGLIWSDPVVGISWGIENPVLSEKDQVFPTLDTISETDLPIY